MSSLSRSSTQHAPVIGELIKATAFREIALTLSGASAIAIASQILIPLPFTPVPLSLATFAVLLTGAALGPIRAGISLGIYLVAGVLGAPVFAEFTSGYGFASFGYIIGYLLAAILVGFLARKAADRSIITMFLTATAGTIIIYAVGAPYLAHALNLSAGDAFMMGIAPFLIGDLIKASAAALLLPGAWKLIKKTSNL